MIQIKKIAIYGKGGIGKSTTTSNLSAALSMQGLKVMQIGCDPKSDSTKNLLGTQKIETVLDTMKRKKDEITLQDIVHVGFNGILCVEAGGPTPGIGCAGRGIISAFETLEKLNAFEVYRPDIVLYDVLGDVVCGGFAMPIRGGYADEVYIVTSGEMMALYAASNISQAVKNFGPMGYAKLRGMILNAKNILDEQATVERAAQEIGTPIIHVVPRDTHVQMAENDGKTVIEAFPDCQMAHVYRALATKIQ